MILILVAPPGLRIAAATGSGQHVWVHYDYMVLRDGRSDAPDPAAIQLVVDAYAAHGIELTIDPKHAAIPAHSLLVPDFDPDFSVATCGTLDAVSFMSLKAQYFHPTANHDWHYAIFGENIGGTGDEGCSPLSSGVAELPGSNFVVALGHSRDIGLPLTPWVVGGTFMHELGHNLGLHHGGNVDDNGKSNYISVMNYNDQFGIPYASALGSTSIAGRRLDYSSRALAPLDEAHLDETVGIGSGTTDLTVFEGPGLVALGAGTGPVDWNQDGNAGERDVAVDLDVSADALSGWPDGDLDVQTGFDDWSEVHAYLAGTFKPGPKTFAREDRAAEPIVATVTPNAGPAAGGTAVTIVGSHFEKTTAVSFGGHPAVTFDVINDGTLAAISPAGGGTVDVVVIAAGNPSPSVLSDQFTYVPPPAITAVTPATGSTLGGTTVVLQGTHLTGATAVMVGARPAANFSVVDDSTISAVTPPGTGTVDIIVATVGGTSATSLVDRFTFVPPPPAVTSTTPTSGYPGTIVTIHGSSFTGASQVCFGGSCVTSVSVTDDNTLTVLVPFSPVEGSTVHVTVTTPAGTSAASPSDLFTLL